MEQQRSPATFFTAAEFKPPGWTGLVQGLGETFGRTPACAQKIAKQPPEGEFLSALTQLPVPEPHRDPCNFAEEHKPSGQAPNLWPPLQETGKQESFKPPRSNIELGDLRIKPFVTSYAQTYTAPLPEGATLRSPLRNPSLEHAPDLKQQYRFAMQRVGEKRLMDVIAHMRERLHGTIGNKNDNAFKLRKFAKMYDKDRTGYIGLEDFRVTTEAQGIQLDDDSLLALFSKYDVAGQGRLEYIKLMQDLLDEDALALFAGGADIHTQPFLSQTFRPGQHSPS